LISMTRRRAPSWLSLRNHNAISYIRRQPGFL
jgi:hypothetical protein